MTKCEEEASNRVTASQTKLNDLNGEHLNWVNVIQQQKKIFSTLELLRTKIENAAPELILKIQAYLASQQDNLAAVLDKLNCQLNEAKSDDVREALQFDILVLSDLLIAKNNLGGRPEDLKKAIEQAVNGTAEERAKALSYFDPLTQVVLKWVFQTTGFSKDTVFLKFKEAVAELGSFSEQHLSELESAIQLESQALKYAKDDYELAQYIVSKVYQACQDARGL